MKHAGFALIQMAVVLIIIGFIAGGILAGRHLIDAAAISAQISQIQKYQAAVVTFQTKYNGYLPGDIPDPKASQFGFQARGQYKGQGDGDGVLEGNCPNNPVGNSGLDQGRGELAVFWQDLSTAGLIDAGIQTGTQRPNTVTPPSPDITLSTSPGIQNWLPLAKLGTNDFVYVMSSRSQSTNYFAISTVVDIGWSISGAGTPGLTVQQAYVIDSKIDDGLPQSGDVMACYVNYNVVNYARIFAAGGGVQGANGGNGCIATTAATPYATTNCYDNNNTAGTQTYSVSKNANAQNCALSFQFQTQ